MNFMIFEPEVTLFVGKVLILYSSKVEKESIYLS